MQLRVHAYLCTPPGGTKYFLLLFCMAGRPGRESVAGCLVCISKNGQNRIGEVRWDLFPTSNSRCRRECQLIRSDTDNFPVLLIKIFDCEP